MAESLRVLTSPVQVTGGLRTAQLVTLLTAEALVGAARADDRAVEWTAGVLTGDLPSQLALEQSLAREGFDRAALGRDEFVARVRDSEAADRAATTELLAAFGIDVDLDAGALDAEPVALAARTAFVRLYEAGLLTRTERVVATCPRCVTVVDDIDTEPGDAPAERVRLQLPASTGAVVEIDAVASELLPGAVAIAVPEGSPLDGASVDLPLADRTVPVIADAETAEPRLVVPAHDAGDLEFARRRGLSPVVVLDADGVVVAPGPLLGLGRYAARGAAAGLLAGEGVVDSAETTDERVARCRRCGTVVVPRLGRHWFLPMADLEVLAADAVRQGLITVSPATAADDLVAGAGQRGEWCLSHQVWAGQPVPVSTCLDCGQVTVSVEPAESCSRCMGQLVADDDVLDARFVGAVWPLACAGWPHAEDGPASAGADTVLVIAPTGLILWAVRMAALGLRLTGAAPFARVGVHDRVDPILYLESVADRGEDAAAFVADMREVAAALARAVLDE